MVKKHKSDLYPMLAFFNHIGEIFKKDNSACEQRIDNFPVLDCLNIHINTKFVEGCITSPRKRFYVYLVSKSKVS